MQKGLLYMDYGLWLLTDDAGRVTLTGYSETDPNPSAPTTTTRTEQWPNYHLCDDRAELPATLRELGLELAAGHDLSDLDKKWDVYLRHPNIGALRAALDDRKATRR